MLFCPVWIDRAQICSKDNIWLLCNSVSNSGIVLYFTIKNARFQSMQATQSKEEQTNIATAKTKYQLNSINVVQEETWKLSDGVKI